MPSKHISGVRPHCFTLIGFPYAGKSTFRNRLIMSATWPTDILVVSMDEYVHSHRGDTPYAVAFGELLEEAATYCAAVLAQAREEVRHVVIDKTNLTRRHRAMITKALPDHCHIGVWFNTTLEECRKRVSQRPDQPIGDDVLDMMGRKFEIPRMQEGVMRIYRSTESSHVFRPS